MALFICLRDLYMTKGSKLWLPLCAMLMAVLMLLITPSWLPTFALPLTLAISLPIFITDKRRNWDGLDHAFRVISLIAILGAAFVTINRMMR